MADEFEIDVMVNGKTVSLSATLVQIGFIHRIILSVSGYDIYFELDDEHNYRVVVENNISSQLKDADKLTIKAVLEYLQQLNN